PVRSVALSTLSLHDALPISFGGASALCLAMDAPQRVGKLVLMGPAGGVVAGATGPTEGIKQLLTYYLGEGPSLEKLQAFIGNLVDRKSTRLNSSHVKISYAV